MSRRRPSQIVHAATAYDVLTRTPQEAANQLASCLPCELAAQQAAVDAEVQAFQTGALRRPWAGVLVMEGVATGDGRMIDPGALTWENLPLNIRWVNEDIGAHANAVVTGTIETIERRDGGVIWGTGWWDLSTEEGMEGARRIENGSQRGVSVDLDSVSFEVRVARDLLSREDDLMEEPASEVTDGEAEDADGRVTVIAIENGDEMFVTTAARIRSATNVAIPAFIEAGIDFTGPAEPVVIAASAQPELPLTLVASAAPVEPPGAWFTDPLLPEPTRLTVTPDGRVYGHVAVWGTCHRTHTQAGRCITPPESPSGYSQFHTGTFQTAEGDLITVGRITLSGGHAPLTMNAAQAAAHYDNTGTIAAYVRAGQDAHGIWIAGALHPGMTAARVQELRASPLSGDWRELGSAQEMVAVLAVNAAGYPIPAARGLVASGRMTALVAAGTLPLDAPRDTLTTEDMELLTRLLDRERAQLAAEEAEAVATQAAALAAEIEAASLAFTVRTS